MFNPQGKKTKRRALKRLVIRPTVVRATDKATGSFDCVQGKIVWTDGCNFGFQDSKSVVMIEEET